MRIEQLLCTLVRNIETIPSCITDSVAVLGHLEAALMIDPMKEQLRKWPRWYRMRWDSWARRFGPTDAIKYNWLGTGTYGIVKMSFWCQMSAWVCLFYFTSGIPYMVSPREKKSFPYLLYKFSSVISIKIYTEIFIIYPFVCPEPTHSVLKFSEPVDLLFNVWYPFSEDFSLCWF